MVNSSNRGLLLITCHVFQVVRHVFLKRFIVRLSHKYRRKHIVQCSVPLMPAFRRKDCNSLFCGKYRNVGRQTIDKENVRI